ncbi:MAG: DUF1846 domain-containing protein [Candidatus Buchananbacteria bacterium]
MSTLKNVGFNTDKYLRLQSKKINDIIKKSKTKLYIEFGGKIVDDKHSARVLPGYREDTKVDLLKKVCRHGEIIFVVSAKDIIKGRIRGDHKITYDKETIRLIKEFRRRGIKIKHVAISLIQDPKNIPPSIKKFTKKLKLLNLKVYYFLANTNYPQKTVNFSEFKNNPFIKSRKKIIAIVSPGGGSGKFGICLSQLYHEILSGITPDYLKFETFPVYDLAIDHPLNLAFMSASADFYDICMRDCRHGKATSYNRDLENYELLNLLAKQFPVGGKNLAKLTSATNMGINMVSRAITNDELVQKEAAAEIARRIIRYKFEIAQGQEDEKVLERARNIIKML